MSDRPLDHEELVGGGPAVGAEAAEELFEPGHGAERRGHPKGLWVLFITEMWERFSYYGMRALLVLYLIASTSEVLSDGTSNENPGFGWSKEQASILYGIYTAAVYLTPLAGGWLADRFLGTHRSLLIGGWIIAAGHLTLACTEFFGITAGQVVTLDTSPGAMLCFMTGLLLIVVGTGFFKPCVSVMVGQLYERSDPRRDSGFTIFYMGINLGAFFSPLVAGTLGEKVGWHWGFGAAAVGMLAGLFFYQVYRPRYLANIGLAPNATPDADSVEKSELRDDASTASRRLTSVEWQRLGVVILLAVLGNIFFWTAFEQAGSSMNIFAKEETDRTLGGTFAEGGLLEGVFDDGSFPASWYQSANPLAILLFAPVFAWLWVWLSRRNLNPSTPMKFAFGLYLLGLAFLAMVAASFQAKGADLAGPHWLLITYVVVTWGELCLSPVGLSMVTKLSPMRLQSLMMGVWFLSFALSNFCAGMVAAFSTRMDTSRHVVTLQSDELNADVRVDARAEEFRVTLVGADGETPVPVSVDRIRFQTAGPNERSVSVSLNATGESTTGEDSASTPRWHQFVAPTSALPGTPADIELVSGTLKVPIDGATVTGELTHDHYTFVFPGLAGFYFMLVVAPLAAGLVITLLTPLMKRMMHGVE